MAPEHDDAQADETIEPLVREDLPGRDPIADIRGIKRVRSVHSVMTPVHRELAPDTLKESKKDAGMGLRLVPFTPAPRKAAMVTLSDFSRRPDPGQPRMVAKPPAAPVEPARVPAPDKAAEPKD